jgi:O-antigen ligase
LPDRLPEFIFPPTLTCVITGYESDPAFLDTGFPGSLEKAPKRSFPVPLLTVYVVLLMFIPSALVLSPLGGAGSPATLFAIALLGWYVSRWLHPACALDRQRQPIRTAALLFGAATLAAYVSANRHTLTPLESNGADRGLILLAGWLGVLLLAADGIERWDRLAALLRRVVAGAAVLAAIGITQFATGLNIAAYIVLPGFTTKVPFVDLLSRDGINRPSATTAQPLEFAAVLVICLPLALHQARFAAPGSRVRCWLQAALICAALPVTVSRSAVLGLAVVALVLVPTWPGRARLRALGLAAAGACLAWAALPKVLTLLFQLFQQVGGESSSTSRIQAYASAAPFILHQPWLGQGFQTFDPQLYFYVDNQYLTSLIETGVAGLAALVTLLVTGWCLARGARRSVSGEATRDLLQSLAGSVAAAAVSFATFDGLAFAIAAGLTFLLLGCTGAAWRLARDEPASPGTSSVTQAN